jgi:hypothetical protein
MDPRSPGIHVSAVIRCLGYEAKILDPKWVDDLSLVDVSNEDWWASLSTPNKLRIAIGLAWEQWYGSTLPAVSFHPGEHQVDGIYMTPDGESVDVLWRERPTDGGLFEHAGHEFKTTYKSTKTVGNLDGQWLWLWQMRAYAKALGTRVFYMHTLFLCGDYKYPITPQFKVWRVEFTQAEIDETWDLITGYVRHRQMQGREDAGLEGGV